MGRAGARVTGRLTLLAATLRAAGVRLGVGEVLAAHRALAAIDPGDRTAAYFALRTTLCSRHEDLAAFDAAFAEWFGRPPARPPVPPALDEAAALVLPRVAVPGTRAAAEQIGGAEVVPAAWADVELLRDKDFAEYSDEERRRARRAMRRLAASVPSAPSPAARASAGAARPRTPPAPTCAARPRLLAHRGDPLERHWREPGSAPARSCSCATCRAPWSPTRACCSRTCRRASRRRRRVEAFVFGTKLTRVTAELAARDPDRALERAAQATDDWSGGTRIGEALATLNREHGRRVGRGAVVVLLSDGWDRGEPEQLEREVARLARCAHRLVWLNPLKAHPGYEPLTRGMQAALPHVDHFMAGNSLASLEELADVLDRLAWGRLGREERYE